MAHWCFPLYTKEDRRFLKNHMFVVFWELPPIPSPADGEELDQGVVS